METVRKMLLLLALAVSFSALARATPAYTTSNFVAQTTLESEDSDCILRTDTTPTIKLDQSYCGSTTYTLPASANVKTYVCGNKNNGGCESHHNVDTEETIDYDCIPYETSVQTQSVTLTCAGSADKTITVEYITASECVCAWTAIRQVTESGTYVKVKSFRTNTAS